MSILMRLNFLGGFLFFIPISYSHILFLYLEMQNVKIKPEQLVTNFVTNIVLKQVNNLNGLLRILSRFAPNMTRNKKSRIQFGFILQRMDIRV